MIKRDKVFLKQCLSLFLWMNELLLDCKNNMNYIQESIILLSRIPIKTNQSITYKNPHERLNITGIEQTRNARMK